MFKTIGIYKNIDDPEAFEDYYISNVLPRLLQFPGVLRVNEQVYLMLRKSSLMDSKMYNY